MKKLWKVLKWGLGVLVLYIGGLLLFGTLTDWTPTGEAPAEVWAPANPNAVIQDSTVRLLTWNLGYGGLGNEDFFFYNKGDFFWTEMGGVRMTKERVRANVTGQTTLVGNTAADLYLLQEVDTAARRSHDVNMLAELRDSRPGFVTAFAPNFKSDRVPIPLFQPWDHYGYVTGGLTSLSRYVPKVSTRIQLPGEFPWPTKLFQLDRCALRQVFPTASGKDLVVYNVHLSAYDKGGGIRRQQIEALRAAVLADYEKGDYVIVGGDWNQLPPGFNWFSFNPTVKKIELPASISFDFMPLGWKFVYDPSVATNRESDLPYDNHRTRRTLIDYYLISPNLKIETIKGLDQSFLYSDHQPVYLEVSLL